MVIITRTLLGLPFKAKLVLGDECCEKSIVMLRKDKIAIFNNLLYKIDADTMFSYDDNI